MTILLLFLWSSSIRTSLHFVGS